MRLITVAEEAYDFNANNLSEINLLLVILPVISCVSYLYLFIHVWWQKAATKTSFCVILWLFMPAEYHNDLLFEICHDIEENSAILTYIKLHWHSSVNWTDAWGPTLRLWEGGTSLGGWEHNNKFISKSKFQLIWSGNFTIDMQWLHLSNILSSHCAVSLLSVYYIHTEHYWHISTLLHWYGSLPS